MLEAKAKNAEAQGKIAKQLQGIGTSALSNFQRYEDKINEMADQSEAMQESLFSQKQLEREFDQLESNVQVANDLDVLKMEMQNEEQKKKEKLEEKKMETLNIKLASQAVPLKQVKQILAPKEEKLKNFFGEK